MSISNKMFLIERFKPKVFISNKLHCDEKCLDIEYFLVQLLLIKVDVLHNILYNM